MRKNILIIFIAVALFIPDAFAERMVRVIYFVPSDRAIQPNLPNQIQKQLKQVQTLYADQMEFHGYSRKTFALDTNVLTIRGQHNDKHYHTDTLNKIDTETAHRFDQNDIRVIVVDVSTERIQGNCGIARYDGGPVMVPASGDCVNGDYGVQLIAHELGHALNLVHDWRNNAYVMSYGAQRSKISECAATLLNVNPYFNLTGHDANHSATITMLTPDYYLENTATFQIRFEISDPDGIYQVQMEHAVLGEDPGLYDCHCVSIKQKAIVTFQMPKDATQSQTNNIWIRVVDINGNIDTKPFTLNAVNQLPTEHEFTYLTLGYESPDAITPINPPKEWGWNWGGWQHTWEKHPNADIPAKPHVGFRDVDNIPFLEKWNHWFYAHAEGKLIYDLTNIAHRQFDAYIYLPNPCGNVASIQLISSVNGTAIYKSGMLRTAQAQNKHIGFDLPDNANRLVIDISNADDGNACDHYILANMRLQHPVQESQETNKTADKHTPYAVTATMKLATSWASLKQR